MATETHCPYCSLQCGLRLVGARAPQVEAWEEFPVNRGRPVPQGLDRRPALLKHRERLTTPLVRDPATGELRAGHLGRGARPHRRPAQCAAGGPRERRGRGLRRRRPDQREGLPAGQVRPRRAGHQPDRLQRPLVHVLGRVGRHPRLRARPRPALPARRPRADRRAGAGRLQPGRDDAARGPPPRRAPRARREGRRGGPAAYADRRPRGRASCSRSPAPTWPWPSACCTWWSPTAPSTRRTSRPAPPASTT